MDDVEERSITHFSQKDFLTKTEIAEKVEEIRIRLIQKYGKNTSKYNEFNKILEDLRDFELGRFLIFNKAISGYWTYYAIVGYKEEIKSRNKIERFILEDSPGLKATRERFNIFQNLVIQSINEDSVCASIPCGLMTEYITLNTDKKLNDVKFIGIDIDKTLFKKIRELSEKHKKSKNRFTFIKEDAWNLNIFNVFDILISNGLTVYVKSDDKVLELYKIFFKALKPNGILIGSAGSIKEEWDINKINAEDLKLHNKIFSFVLEATWSNFRSANKTETQLKESGFRDIKFYWDTQKMIYTFQARK